MKLTHLVLGCAALIAAAACSNNNIDENATTLHNEFLLNASIAQTPVMRTPQLDSNGSGTFTTGDKNQLLFLSSSHESLQQFTYTHGNSYHWADLQLPEGHVTGQLAAWYPAQQTETPAAFSWNVMSQSNPDLLVATPVAIKIGQEEPIQLTFKHLMHKLHVKVESGHPSITPSDLAAATLTLRNFYPTASVNLTQGTSGAVSGDLASISRTQAETSFILPAQAAGNMAVEVSVKGKTAVYPIAEISIQDQLVSQLESGKSLSLIITATQHELVLSISSAIEGWGNQGEKNDQIII